MLVVRGGDDGGWEVLRFGRVRRSSGDGINSKRCRMWTPVTGGRERWKLILNPGIFLLSVVSLGKSTMDWRQDKLAYGEHGLDVIGRREIIQSLVSLAQRQLRKLNLRWWE